MKRRLVILGTLLLLCVGARANPAVEEIDYLLDSIGASHCTFVRNGKRHDAREAEAHLRMKYRRGKKHAPDAERFISRLASKSSMTGKPYFMNCKGEEPQEAGDWLLRKLEAFRNRTPSGS